MWYRLLLGFDAVLSVDRVFESRYAKGVVVGLHGPYEDCLCYWRSFCMWGVFISRSNVM